MSSADYRKVGRWREGGELRKLGLIDIKVFVQIVVNNAKAAAILVGAFLLTIGVLIPSLWLGLVGFGTLMVSVLASIPKDVRRWLMIGLGKAAKDLWYGVK